MCKPGKRGGGTAADISFVVESLSRPAGLLESLLEYPSQPLTSEPAFDMVVEIERLCALEVMVWTRRADQLEPKEISWRA